MPGGRVVARALSARADRRARIVGLVGAVVVHGGFGAFAATTEASPVGPAPRHVAVSALVAIEVVVPAARGPSPSAGTPPPRSSPAPRGASVAPRSSERSVAADAAPDDALETFELDGSIVVASAPDPGTSATPGRAASTAIPASAGRPSAPTSAGRPSAPTSATPDGSGVDRTRPVGLDDRAWRCAWPAEADALAVDEAFVVLRVSVRDDGTVERVHPLVDPGDGFGRAAARCAMRTRFVAARDRDGRPIATDAASIRGRFSR